MRRPITTLLALGAVLALLAGCQGAPLPNRAFACSTEADCTTGFTCSAGVCVAMGAAGSGSTSTTATASASSASNSTSASTLASASAGTSSMGGASTGHTASSSGASSGSTPSATSSSAVAASSASSSSLSSSSSGSSASSSSSGGSSSSGSLPIGSSCSASNDCASDVCLAGFCCPTSCGGGTCAATACGTDGGCFFPSGTSCSAATCAVVSGQPVAQAAGTCNGDGTCAALSTSCGAFACDSSTATCRATCSSSSDCFGSAYCTASVCCASVGTDVYVNGSDGADVTCCGAASQPCLTLGFAMAQIRADLDEGGVSRTVTLHAVATLADAGPQMWRGPETWPVQLDHGVVLEAPDVAFAGLPDSGLFVATRLSLVDGGDDGQGPVTLRGEPGHPMAVGFDLDLLADAGLEDGGFRRDIIPSVGLLVSQGSAVAADLIAAGAQEGIWVESGGTLSVGDGPVTVGGWPLPDAGFFDSPGWSLICYSEDGGAGLVTDQGATGAGQMIALPTTGDGFGVYDGCTLQLLRSPSFGATPVNGVCPLGYPYGAGNGSYGDLVIGAITDDAIVPPQVALQGVTLQCSGYGAYIWGDGEALPDGGPIPVGEIISVDGGMAQACSVSVFEVEISAAAGSPNSFSLSHFHFGPPSCQATLENGAPFQETFDDFFSVISVSDAQIDCDQGSFAVHSASTPPVGTVVMDGVSFSGVDPTIRRRLGGGYALSTEVAQTVATNLTLKGNNGGLEILGGDLSLDGGTLSCNPEANLNLGTDVTADISNVLWDNSPPTECVATCVAGLGPNGDAGPYPDGGLCIPCPDAGIDVLLNDTTPSLSLHNASKAGNSCHY